MLDSGYWANFARREHNVDCEKVCPCARENTHKDFSPAFIGSPIRTNTPNPPQRGSSYSGKTQRPLKRFHWIPSQSLCAVCISHYLIHMGTPNWE